LAEIFNRRPGDVETREAGEAGEAVPASRSTLRATLACGAVLTAVVGLTACGGGSKDPSGTWKVDVLSASFPGKQRLAEDSELRITVKNVDSRAVPNLVVTVDGFNSRNDDPTLADPNRPIWFVDHGPPNTTTAYSNTWAMGKVPAGATRTFVWKVSAVRAGTYTLRFRVDASLRGKARARAPDGSIPQGSFIARISHRPRPVNIN
jgi:hypothetical protein